MLSLGLLRFGPRLAASWSGRGGLGAYSWLLARWLRATRLWFIVHFLYFQSEIRSWQLFLRVRLLLRQFRPFLQCCNVLLFFTFISWCRGFWSCLRALCSMRVLWSSTLACRCNFYELLRVRGQNFSTRSGNFRSTKVDWGRLLHRTLVLFFLGLFGGLA